MRWKAGVSAILALLLMACGSSSVTKYYYQLPSVMLTDKAVHQTGTAKKFLLVEGIQVADYLDGMGLMYQTSAVKYTMANSNLWASPLNQQLQQTLVDNLSVLLPSWLVSTQPHYDADQATINVVITGFHGRYDGKVVVRGSWLMNYQNRVIKSPFDIEILQTEDGYDALVKALAQGWEKVAEPIAAQLSQLTSRSSVQ